jgi:galactokinase/mevalonate kinase-like predicted kinase
VVGLAGGGPATRMRPLTEKIPNKKKRSDGMCNPQIDEGYSHGMANGTAGDKLIGACDGEGAKVLIS